MTDASPTEPAAGRAQQVTVSLEDVVLAGEIHVPTTDVHGGILMLAGSGAADRHNFGLFPPLRDHFVSCGFAVMCYDKPGTGQSGGDWRHRSFPYDQAREAAEALRTLARELKGRTSRIGVWGFSQGGWIAPLAASMASAAKFVILVSGPCVPPAEQNEYDVVTRMRRDGLSSVEVETGRMYVADVVAASREALSYDEVDRQVLGPNRDHPWARYFGFTTADDWEFFRRSDCDYDPAPVLAGLDCPILAVFGDLDQLVPVRRSIEVFSRATSGNGQANVRVFAGADHGIRTAGQFVDGYPDVISEWLLAMSNSKPPHS